MKQRRSMLLLGLLGLVWSVAIGYAAQVGDVASLTLVITTTNGTCTTLIAFTDGTVFGMAGTYEVTTANNPEGNFLFQCTGELTSEPPTRAIKADGDRAGAFGCFDGEDALVAENWSLLLTPSGNAKYTCHVNPSHTP